MATIHAPDTTIGPFRERNSVVLRGVVMDAQDPRVPVPGSSLSSAVMTLYAEDDDHTIINGQDHVDIAPYVDEEGNLELVLGSDDMVILDDTETYEYHRALLEWAWSDGSPTVLYAASWEVRIIVRNMNAVPGGTP